MGVANQTFMEWARWNKKIRPASSKALICQSINESQSKEICVFNIKFKEEELIQACDRLVKAFEALDNGNFEESIKLSSESLNMALKDWIGWNSEGFSFDKALRTFPKVGIILQSSDQALKFYTQANKMVHHDFGIKVLSEDSYRIALFSRRFITELEGIKLTNKQRTSIKNLLKK
jgi:hypothetical protein